MNPIELCDVLEDRYRRYLETTFEFRDPELRRLFGEQLANGHLRKGPFLEGSGAFQLGASLHEVVADFGLDLDQATSQALYGDRPLYQHQERAIRRVLGGSNVVVATGTGSGKTESFLFPILLHLYREHLEGTLGPGVRAMILYPMNALANDQRERLGELFTRLVGRGSSFRFTFGQYIGATPNDRSDRRRDVDDLLRESDRAGLRPEDGSGELVLRSEMRERPPHILLTNFSMLEYLLLRPDDSPLFDKGAAAPWRFLVLDEAHQYRGAKGIEMAMLVRRLKTRLRHGGRKEPFTCIATSATLTDASADPARVVDFANSLYGEDFSPEGVILAELKPGVEPRSREIDPEDLHRLAETSEADLDAAVAECASRYDVDLQADTPHLRLGELLVVDRRVGKLRVRLADAPSPVGELADELFGPGPDSVRSLFYFLELILRAQDPVTRGTLFDFRYHVFLRALEGAYVRLYPALELSLERRSPGGEDGPFFEAALCRECGQHYFVGRVDRVTKRLVEAIRDPSDPGFGVDFYRPVEAAEADEGSTDADDAPLLELCIRCGRLEDEAGCEHHAAIKVRRERVATSRDRPDELTACGACGYTASGRDPVREVVHGTDGPNAVLATALYTTVEPDRRKILAFADGRQEAAFFAWYMQSSYEDIARRSRVVAAIRSLMQVSPAGVTINEIGASLAETLRSDGVIEEQAGDIDVLKRAWSDAYREFAVTHSKVSLEGVGLIRWELRKPAAFEVPASLMESPLCLDGEEAWQLVALLLGTMRFDRAFDLRGPAGVPLVWEEAIGDYAQTWFVLGPPGGVKKVSSWDGPRARRMALLRKLAPPGTEDGPLLQVLREIWAACRDHSDGSRGQDGGLFRRAQQGAVLDPTWWRAIAPTEVPDRCDSCGRLSFGSLRGLCTAPKCTGSVAPLHPERAARHHYRFLYESELPPRMRVEEHTAQLERDVARDFQRRFKRGGIDLLSSSTTFELGVDLGDLDLVFLRNVPPEAFNYVQRVGRAGRRRGQPGLAVTYCRRSSHDLFHFANPERMLKGESKAPVLSLENEKIVARHGVAVALSAFFRSQPERFASVESLVGDLADPTFASDLKRFAREKSSELRAELDAVVPDGSHLALGLRSDGWIGSLGIGSLDGSARLELAEAELQADAKALQDLEASAAAEQRYRDADWAKRRLATMKREDVLSFLSRKAVIPKYGFPVDVVELDTRLAAPEATVSLSRDLAIAVSEFAPGNKLIANKKVWSSHALTKIPGKEWPRYRYRRCPTHNTFQRWRVGEEEPPQVCACRMQRGEFVVPSFGFKASREPPTEPRGRLGRLYSTRPYFDRAVHGDGDEFGIPAANPVLTVMKAAPGWMVTVCEGARGKGFYICGSCGTGDTKVRPSHKTVLGRPCKGRMGHVALAHEFVTDVLQLSIHVPLEAEADPLWAGFAVAFAMVHATANVLDIPSADVSATVQPSGFALPRIIVFDDVPGGAGLVSRLEDPRVLIDVLSAAAARVDGSCGCDEDTTCYGCLREYRNQFAHPYLRRGDARAVLSNLLGRLG